MQDVLPPLAEGMHRLDAYDAEGFVISGTRHEGAVLVCATHVISAPELAIAHLSEASFDAVFALSPAPEILLVGTGAQHHFIAPQWRNVTKQRGIVLESMDTGAACRTYNVLLAEGRRVAALLALPV
jgi:uncharacterized protein